MSENLVASKNDDLINFASPKFNNNNNSSNNSSLLLSIKNNNTAAKNLLDTSINEDIMNYIKNNKNILSSNDHENRNNYDLLISPQKFNEDSSNNLNNNNTNLSKDFSDISSMDQTSLESSNQKKTNINNNIINLNEQSNLDIIDFIEVSNDLINVDQEDFWLCDPKQIKNNTSSKQQTNKENQVLNDIKNKNIDVNSNNNNHNNVNLINTNISNHMDQTENINNVNNSNNNTANKLVNTNSKNKNPYKWIMEEFEDKNLDKVKRNLLVTLDDISKGNNRRSRSVSTTRTPYYNSTNQYSNMMMQNNNIHNSNQYNHTNHHHHHHHHHHHNNQNINHHNNNNTNNNKMNQDHNEINYSNSNDKNLVQQSKSIESILNESKADDSLYNNINEVENSNESFNLTLSKENGNHLFKKDSRNDSSVIIIPTSYTLSKENIVNNKIRIMRNKNKLLNSPKLPLNSNDSYSPSSPSSSSMALTSLSSNTSSSHNNYKNDHYLKKFNRHLLINNSLINNFNYNDRNTIKSNSRKSRSRSRARTTPIYFNMLNDPSVLTINQIIYSDHQQDWLLSSNCDDILTTPCSISSSILINQDDLEFFNSNLSLNRTCNDESKQALASSIDSSRSSSLTTNKNTTSQAIEWLDENVFFDDMESIKLKSKRKYFHKILSSSNKPVNQNNKEEKLDQTFENDIDEVDNNDLSNQIIDDLIEELDNHINSSYNSSVQSIQSIKYLNSNSPFSNSCLCKIKCYCSCHRLRSSSSKTNTNSLASSVTSQHSKTQHPSISSSNHVNSSSIKESFKLKLKAKCKSLDSYDSLEWDVSIDNKKLNSDYNELINDDLTDEKLNDNNNENVIDSSSNYQHSNGGVNINNDFSSNTIIKKKTSNSNNYKYELNSNNNFDSNDNNNTDFYNGSSSSVGKLIECDSNINDEYIHSEDNQLITPNQDQNQYQDILDVQVIAKIQEESLRQSVLNNHHNNETLLNNGRSNFSLNSNQKQLTNGNNVNNPIHPHQFVRNQQSGYSSATITKRISNHRPSVNGGLHHMPLSNFDYENSASVRRDSASSSEHSSMSSNFESPYTSHVNVNAFYWDEDVISENENNNRTNDNNNQNKTICVCCECSNNFIGSHNNRKIQKLQIHNLKIKTSSNNSNEDIIGNYSINAPPPQPPHSSKSIKKAPRNSMDTNTNLLISTQRQQQSIPINSYQTITKSNTISHGISSPSLSISTQNRHQMKTTTSTTGSSSRSTTPSSLKQNSLSLARNQPSNIIPTPRSSRNSVERSIPTQQKTNFKSKSPSSINRQTNSLAKPPPAPIYQTPSQTGGGRSRPLLSYGQQRSATTSIVPSNTSSSVSSSSRLTVQQGARQQQLAQQQLHLQYVEQQKKLSEKQHNENMRATMSRASTNQSIASSTTTTSSNTTTASTTSPSSLSSISASSSINQIHPINSSSPRSRNQSPSSYNKNSVFISPSGLLTDGPLVRRPSTIRDRSSSPSNNQYGELKKSVHNGSNQNMNLVHHNQESSTKITAASPMTVRKANMQQISTRKSFLPQPVSLSSTVKQQTNTNRTSSISPPRDESWKNGCY